jgi:hypothetical protein
MTTLVPDARSSHRPPPPRPRASTAGYWVAGALAGAAVLGALVWLALGALFLDARVNHFVRLAVPQSATLNVRQPGTYILYAEGDMAGALYVTAPDGAPIALRPYSGDLSYDVDGHHGTAFAALRVSRAGQYLVRTEGTGPGARVVVGADLTAWRLADTVGPAVLGAVGLCAALALTITTLVRRAPTGPPSGNATMAR